MTYWTDRLPKDLAVSALGGLAGAFVGGLLTCAEATRQFTKAYPHDGQNGLGGVYFGVLSMLFFGPIAAGVTFVVRYLQYRKFVHLEEERAFEAELLEARSSKETR
jgi:hypothetical protein